jgi:hypothetical protein
LMAYGKNAVSLITSITTTPMREMPKRVPQIFSVGHSLTIIPLLLQDPLCGEKPYLFLRNPFQV